MVSKVLKSAGIAGMIFSASVVGAADGDADSNTLPDAEAGECYAKVAVPAVYKTEPVSTLIKEATDRIEVTPAKYASTQERVKVKDSYTVLKPVPPIFDVVEEKVMVSPASRAWVRDSLRGEVPVSAGTLADLTSNGVKVDEVKPGQCYYEYYTTDQYKSVQQKVLISQAYDKLEPIPARFSKSAKQVMVKAASKRLVEVPAVFKSVKEEVLIEPAHKEWTKGRGLIERIDNSTGEIMCLVNVPAKYKTIEKQVVKSPAVTTTVMVPAVFKAVAVESTAADAKEARTKVPAKFESVTRQQKVSDGKISWAASKNADAGQYGKLTGNAVCFKETPAKFKTVERRIVKSPAKFTTQEVPAKFTDVKVEKLVTDAVERKVKIPAVTDTLVRRVKVSDARMEWRSVLCETNITPNIVEQIQSSLNSRGYSAGKVDGKLGRATLSAMEKFQEDKNLATGGMTYNTIKALGIDL